MSPTICSSREWYTVKTFGKRCPPPEPSKTYAVTSVSWTVGGRRGLGRAGVKRDSLAATQVKFRVFFSTWSSTEPMAHLYSLSAHDEHSAATGPRPPGMFRRTIASVIVYRPLPNLWDSILALLFNNSYVQNVKKRQ